MDVKEDGKGTKWHRNIAKNFNRLSRAYERYRQTDRQTTDKRQTDERQHIAIVSSRSLKIAITLFAVNVHVPQVSLYSCET